MGERLLANRATLARLLIAKRVRPGIEEYYKLIYEGDAVDNLTSTMALAMFTHKHFFPEYDITKSLAPIVDFIDENGDNLGCEIMTIEQIKDSWRMSKNFSAVRNANRKIEHAPRF
jgi:hypothetical protein